MSPTTVRMMLLLVAALDAFSRKVWAAATSMVAFCHPLYAVTTIPMPAAKGPHHEAVSLIKVKVLRTASPIDRMMETAPGSPSGTAKSPLKNSAIPAPAFCKVGISTSRKTGMILSTTHCLTDS